MDSVLGVAVPEVILDQPQVVALVSEEESARMAKHMCSDLRTSGAVLENITSLGSDYLRMKRCLGSHYLRMSANYLRRAHMIENETRVVRTDGLRHRAKPTARILSASSRVRPASS